MNKKFTLVIGLQALIIITLFWMLVFYGKDEYEAFQSEQEEEIESPSRVTERDGINIVKLSPATQENSGIITSKIESTQYEGTLKSFGTVLDIQPLLNSKTQYFNLYSELAVAKANSDHLRQQYQRLLALNADDKNISDRALQEAQALVTDNQAKIQAIQTQLTHMQANLSAQWGASLSKLATVNNPSAAMSGLLTQQQVLIQISLPVKTAEPVAGSFIYVTPLNEGVAPIKATFLSRANQSDISGIGKTYYYIAPAQALRSGMRVNVIQIKSNTSVRTGSIIPNEAIVWHGGNAWAYVKANNDQFVRKPVITDTELDNGWFSQTIPPGTEVVTHGAQLLLSEEFKYLIKNENED
jgi:hypothetical protein